MSDDALPVALMSGLYFDADPLRQAEFMECIRRNAENPFIHQLLIFVEMKADLSALAALYPQLASPKVHLIAHGRRLTYKVLFAYANAHLRGMHVIIANADIFFDRSLARLATCEMEGKLFCLSRWNVDSDGSSHFFEHPSSQDAWVFSAPLPEINCEFPMGLPGCDNRLAWEASRPGLAVSNPGRSIRAHHLHLTAVHRYTERERIWGPALSVPAGFLDTPWLWFVIPCMGRIDDLRQCLASLLAEPSSTCVVVDYSCPQRAAAWLAENYPKVPIVSCRNRSQFCGADARNRGTAIVDDDGLICFMDADIVAAPGFAKHVLSNCASDGFPRSGF